MTTYNIGNATQTQYNNQKAAGTDVNDWTRTLNGENGTDTQLASGWYDGSYDKYGTTRRWHGKKNHWHNHYNNFNINSNTGNAALDDYYKANQYNTDWDTYNNNQSTNYTQAFNNANKTTRNDTINSSIGTYNPANVDGTYSSLVNTQNNDYYNEALKAIQAQADAGYLSYNGYQTAAQELADAVAANYGGLSSLASNQYNTWNDEIGNAYDANIKDNYLSEANGVPSWYRYYDNWMGNNGKSFSDMLANSVAAANSYAQNNVNDDAFLAAMQVNGNPYDWDEYIATGADQQGMNDLYIPGISTSRRKVGLQNIGEF